MSPLKYALLGWPVKHSVSPQMQGAAFAALDIDATYELIETPPEQLEATIEQMRRKGYAGWNVTVPHKEKILPLLDEVDSGARRAGSVNTVINRNGRLIGYSTDGYGLAMALKESFTIDIAAHKFLFWGCGGAARATAIYFGAQGAKEIILVNRTRAKAESIVADLAAVAPECGTLCLSPSRLDQIKSALNSVDVLIQATSLGLHPHDPLPLAPDLVPARLAVFDMIYRETPLLTAVAARGCRIADGRGMLLHQGVRSFMLWTGRPGPVEIMRAALDKALA